MRGAVTVRVVLSSLLVVMLVLSGIPGVFASSGVVLDTQQVFEPSPGANRRFGQSVAIDGDTAVIGARGATTSAGTNRGAAYVYVRTPSGWQYEATLAADDGQSGDWFGNVVAIEGDTVVVSAPNADARATDSGAAYVFTRTGTAWTQRTKLVPSDSAANDYCGGALAVSGPMVFVGSGRHNGWRGAVWLFTESDGSWAETRKFSEDVAEESRFGDAIAISGSRLLIAAPWESLDGLDTAGKVYTYRLGTSGWVSGGTIGPDTPVADGRFGAALAFDGARGRGVPGLVVVGRRRPRLRSAGDGFEHPVDPHPNDHPHGAGPDVRRNGQALGRAHAGRRERTGPSVHLHRRCWIDMDSRDDDRRSRAR